jgi:outer membrane scaffolding protein for murein synthesis (MipA/OmpV family)
MTKRIWAAQHALSMLFCLAPSYAARAADLLSQDSAPPSDWIVELGGYGVFEPRYEGSKSYVTGFKPIIDFHKEGDRVWPFFPNDAITYDLFETSNFRAGPAGDITLQSRFHSPDVNLQIGKADVNLQGGAFAEIYPVDNVRGRIEVLRGLTGNTGFSINLMSDYIWKPDARWTITAGPRAQIVDDEYASEYFSSQLAIRNGRYVKYKAEGGLLSAGAELTGTYDWTQNIATRFFIDYSRLTGDAADSPRVDLKGSPDQVTVGIGVSYKFKVEH